MDEGTRRKKDRVNKCNITLQYFYITKERGMKIISSVGAKGGSGKSSVALFLAWELSKTHKAKVAILDGDIQGTCISAKALNPELPFSVNSIGTTKQLLDRGRELEEAGYEYIIIDGNPRSIDEDPALIKRIANLSDLNLIVSRPCARDIKAQIKYIKMVKDYTKGEIRLLWNFFRKNTVAHPRSVPQAEKLLDLRSLETKICLRMVYEDIGYMENYVDDFGNSEASNEIKSLGNEVRRIVNGKK